MDAGQGLSLVFFLGFFFFFFEQVKKSKFFSFFLGIRRRKQDAARNKFACLEHKQNTRKQEV